jgi:hypothetical protein
MFPSAEAEAEAEADVDDAVLDMIQEEYIALSRCIVFNFYDFLRLYELFDT